MRWRWFVCLTVACPLYVDDNLCLIGSLPLLRRMHVRRVSVFSCCCCSKISLHWVRPVTSLQYLPLLNVTGIIRICCVFKQVKLLFNVCFGHRVTVATYTFQIKTNFVARTKSVRWQNRVRSLLVRLTFVLKHTVKYSWLWQHVELCVKLKLYCYGDRYLQMFANMTSLRLRAQWVFYFYHAPALGMDLSVRPSLYNFNRRIRPFIQSCDFHQTVVLKTLVFDGVEVLWKFERYTPANQLFRLVLPFWNSKNSKSRMRNTPAAAPQQQTIIRMTSSSSGRLQGSQWYFLVWVSSHFLFKLFIQLITSFSDSVIGWAVWLNHICFISVRRQLVPGRSSPRFSQSTLGDVTSLNQSRPITLSGVFRSQVIL